MASTPEQVIDRVFTTANPETGSLPPPQIAWAVFAHGTAFFSAPTDELAADASAEAIATAARAAISELGPVGAGSASADFNPVRLDGWFPDEPVWFVGFDHPGIATVVTIDATDLVAGLAGRSRRQLDHDEQQIVCVRRFDGTTSRP